MEYIDYIIKELTIMKQFNETFLDEMFLDKFGTFEHIPGLSKYKISDRGYVQNKKTLKLLFPREKKDGHAYYLLSDDFGIRSRYPIRFLVADTFIPNEGRLLNVEHIDGDKTNNEVTNLRRV
jgi:hypothetical protein